MAERFNVQSPPYGQKQENEAAEQRAPDAETVEVPETEAPETPESLPAEGGSAPQESPVRGALSIPQSIQRPQVRKTPMERDQGIGLMWSVLAENPTFAAIAKRMLRED